MSEEYTPVGTVDEFPTGRGRAVTAAGKRVAVFRLGDRWYALGDSCPHMGASLADGRIDGPNVVCAWHDRQFNLETGESNMRSGACAHVYRVRVEAGNVLIAPPLPARPQTDDEEEWVRFDPDMAFKKKDAG